jgi:hypothetical protein
MEVILPFIAIALLLLLLDKQEACWRNAVLTSSVIWGVLIIGITEGLSVLHLLTSSGVCISWITINGFLGWLVWRRVGIWQPRQIDLNLWQLPLEHTVLLSGVVGITSVVGLISLIAAPNNWDSLAYVMPRVIHWIQNRTVDHYPTHYPPQLYNGPWAEFVILQLQLLSGSDRFANLVHWFSLIGSLIGVSLIAKQLGANLRSQIFSVVFCATIPVGILHVSTPKNTYVVAFWLICLFYYGLTIATTKLTWRLTLLFSASLGLAVLTKGSAYVYALPSILILLVLQLYRSKVHLLKNLTISIAIVIGLNLGHYIRNFYVFGSPTSTYPYKWTNDVYSVSVLISNVVRNMSLHLAIPFISGSGWVDQGVIQLHYFLGISPIDQRTTLLDAGSFSKPEEFTIGSSPLFEDVAGNSLHFWLIIAVIFSIASHARLRKNFHLVGYLGVTLSSFFLFCFLLKWQPWHSRLHLPIFVIISPIVGIVLDTTWPRKAARYMLLILLLSTTPYLLFNDLRPLIGDASILTRDRIIQSFTARSSLQTDYQKVAQLVKQQACQNVGLIITPGSWEYPLWSLLQEKGNPPVRLEHVVVQNKTGAIARPSLDQSFVPCSIIAVGNALNLNDRLTVHGQGYKKGWHSSASGELVQEFVPVPPVPKLGS